MKFFFKPIFLCFFTIFLPSCLKACLIEKKINFSPLNDPIKIEADSLLFNAEKNLFLGNFLSALTDIERAESILSPDDNLFLRTLFDKALAITCIKNSLQASEEYFNEFEEYLSKKSCNYSFISFQNGKNHWPIYGPDVMPREQCVDAADNTLKKALIAAGRLPLTRDVIFDLETKLLTIGAKARECCIANGYWKTCLQPLVDAWQVMLKCYRIPSEYCAD